MPLDIERFIGSVTREIADREIDGRPARGIVATRTFDASPADVWDALTHPERLRRWFLPVSGDLHLGGRYQLEGNAGGEITACDPPRHLGLTWGMAGQVSWVNVELSAVDGRRTRLRLEHLAPTPDQTWDDYGPGATGVGWDQALLGLDQYFTAATSVTPETAEEWLVSDEAKAFIRAGCNSWGEADIEAGTDPETARTRAETTRQFYTGEGSTEEGGTGEDSESE